MEDQSTPTRCDRRDLVLLLILLALAATMRLWLFCHTEVAARDSIGYIRIAWQLEHHGWYDAVTRAERHPGYPLLIAAAFHVVRLFHAGPEPLTWQLSAQLVSVLAGTLLVIPTYLLGRALFNRWSGFGAALLFQCLPAAGQVLSDGLAEATFLLAATTGLYLAVLGFGRQSPTCFMLCGVCGGLAYLIRPEGVLVAAAAGSVLLGAQAIGPWRQRWDRCLASATGLAVAVVLVGGPLFLTTGRFTSKPAGAKLLPGGEPEVPGGAPPAALAPGQPLVGALFGIWYKGNDPGERPWWGVKAVGYELIKGFHHFAWVPVLLGLWWYREQLRAGPAPWVLIVTCLLLLGLLWRLATNAGYVSDRHALLVILCGCIWAAPALAVLGQWLAAAVSRWLSVSPTLCSLGLLAALVIPALPKTLATLHEERRGFREVGLWLADNVPPDDVILDPYSWAYYFAGRAYEGGWPSMPRRPFTCYVVVEEAGNPHPRLSGWLGQALWMKERGQPIHRWKAQRRKDLADIVVYAVAMPGRKP